MGKLTIWLNDDLFWRIDPPLADEVWRRLGLEKSTMVMASEFAEAVAASTSSPPKALRALLDEINAEIEAGDSSTMVIVEPTQTKKRRSSARKAGTA
jgi:hypothetical protein